MSIRKRLTGLLVGSALLFGGLTLGGNTVTKATPNIEFSNPINADIQFIDRQDLDEAGRYIDDFNVDKPQRISHPKHRGDLNIGQF